MKNNYILIGAISALVFAAIIYGFSVAGFPGDVRGKRFDETRVSNLRQIKMQIENYAATKNYLPQTLEELQENDTYLKIKDPETEKNYEYYVTGMNSYKLCAKFSTASEEDEKNKPGMYEYSSNFGNYDFKHGEGNQCFEFTATSIYKPDPYDYYNYTYPSPYVYPTSKPFYLSPTPLPRSIDDENISSVSTNVSYDNYLSVFPAGFFSSREEYGLINYHNEPVTVTIEFYYPVKIAKITNIFSYCTDKICYKWDVKGITEGNKSLPLGESIMVGNQSDTSEHTVNSNERFKQLMFEVERVGGPDHYVHWKKIKIDYK